MHKKEQHHLDCKYLLLLAVPNVMLLTTHGSLFLHFSWGTVKWEPQQKHMLVRWDLVYLHQQQTQTLQQIEWSTSSHDKWSEFFLAYFHGVLISLQVDKMHVSVPGEWISICLVLFLWTWQVVQHHSKRSPMIGELKDVRMRGKGSALSHAALEKGIETIIASICVPHPDELDHATQRHQTYDLIPPALSTSHVHLKLVLLGSLGDADFLWTVATHHGTIAIHFHHVQRLVLICLFVFLLVQLLCFLWVTCATMCSLKKCHHGRLCPCMFAPMQILCSFAAVHLLGALEGAVPICANNFWRTIKSCQSIREGVKLTCQGDRYANQTPCCIANLKLCHSGAPCMHKSNR